MGKHKWGHMMQRMLLLYHAAAHTDAYAHMNIPSACAPHHPCRNAQPTLSRTPL